MPSTRRVILGHVMSGVCTKMNRTKKLPSDIMQTPLNRCLNTFDITLLGQICLFRHYNRRITKSSILFRNRQYGWCWSICFNWDRCKGYCRSRNSVILYNCCNGVDVSRYIKLIQFIGSLFNEKSILFLSALCYAEFGCNKIFRLLWLTL